MIEALKSEELSNKVGGKFKLSALIQRRIVEILEGARPMIERQKGMTDLEVVVQEILEDKLAIDYDSCDIIPPAELAKAAHGKARKK